MGEFFTAPIQDADDTVLDLVTERMSHNPTYQDRFAAIKELRDQNSQGLSLSVGEAAKANGFFRVASLQGPLENLMKVLDPNFLKEKKRFYRWLSGPGAKHCTYDRRKENPTVTFSDGKAVS